MSVVKPAPILSAYKMGQGNAPICSHLFLRFESIVERRCRAEQGRKKESSMLEGKAMVEDTDMPVKMQLQAMSAASKALDRFDVLDCRSIAAHIKKEFDMIHGSGWQCVVGSSFGCYFTHSKGSFIYFKLESLRFLVFKGAAA